MKILCCRSLSRKSGLILEEPLTSVRSKLLSKCRWLRQRGLIEEAYTRGGNVYAVVSPTEEGSKPVTLLVVTDTHYDNLLKLTKGLGEEVDWCSDQVVRSEGEEETDDDEEDDDSDSDDDDDT